ncbi:MAG TPA: MGMT family protein [Trebonia sp.]|nr:MGMT family protein [Trebonia sp.]
MSRPPSGSARPSPATTSPACPTPSDSAAPTRPHRGLERPADAEGLLDVAYTTVDSPVGTLLLAATPRGLVQVAELAGNPRAVRAVGTACATNPLPVVVPCHRVLRGDGTPGGYIGGPAAKTTLLTLEGAA